ncbi:F-box protein CPR1-like [Cornus florida]|uniref:F-box protein CPR1-like n=1 Tax=Cornus florida TaxID=4283 RepID=UPI00289AA643|nr:F-box protein CPR1-like [Cornus florida]XP_059665481.1 F-box protein CPR1-like [Cornus florida]XP_059665482.1 F-box protein CPR1-like [Cornus florida]XP_059665483.1 F-box protein CPR1-like [Cornus florida]XP_059665484.1 F-box protein CPR1-like [Cornus florida]XP_059665485.1 F-box protein CPR1-like [Cornus florida]XP_059665486.1 F-box protein CPR1-like [Cornus florida]XP_059665487.1 F-box protein CPR1-like [Cornus florida]XP_059665488.1 F-box protein CPR1-like [Cornus florida]XP_05966549
MSDYLPEDVLIDIFTRLPIKTLLQIRCVCKSLYALINNPSFITAHINRTISHTNTPLLLLNYHIDKKEHYSIHCDDKTFVECTVCHSSISYLRVVGSCNGLICLSDDIHGYTDLIILWNPAIDKSVTLTFASDSHECVLGFGFDSRANDYKVVRIVYLHDSFESEVDVYELSTGLWRSIGTAAPLYHMILCHLSHVFVNGASHWIAIEENRYLILSFDMGSEVFKEIMLPSSISNGNKLKLSVARFGESLSLFHYGEEELIWMTSKSCCIWVMKEYGVVSSWTKLFTVGLRGISKVLGFRKTGEVLVGMGNGELVSYDPKSKKVVFTGICGYRSPFHLDTYVESLVLLGRKKLKS